MGLSDNGYVSLYTYDAGGERVTKQASSGGAAFVNSKDAGGHTQTDNYTAYINPYFVLSSGRQYTKHVMVNGQRIVSKLGDVGSFGEDPRRIQYAGDTEGIQIDYPTKYGTAQQVIRNSYDHLEVEYYGEDNNDFQGGQGFCCGDKTADKAASKTDDDGITTGDDPELYQFYYHADHLGSASYITNLDGEIAQHIEYVPFGEVFLEERNNIWNSPYLFNGKERDEETGLSYYGARGAITRGGSLLLQVGANAGAEVVGGAVDRAISGEKVLDGVEILTDVIAGGTGGALAKGSEALFETEIVKKGTTAVIERLGSVATKKKQ